MRRAIWLVTALTLLVLAPPRAGAALKVGYRVKSVKVWDANNKPAWIPEIGKKVIAFFYTDPDVQDQNERFREELNATKLDPKKVYSCGIGVVNMKDTWKPNFAIRSVVRSKIKKFKSLILTDKEHVLRNKWGLGDCNEKDVVIIIDVNRKVRYIKKTGAMSAAERKKVIALFRKLVEEAKARKAKK
jgi:predicted transcriptional regulator